MARKSSIEDLQVEAPSKPDKTPSKPDQTGSMGSTEGVVQIYKPTARECALLLLKLWRLREAEKGKNYSRLCISETSLKHLWGRNRISPALIEEVVEWLAGAGTTLFLSGSIYGFIRISVVERWPRTTSKRLTSVINEVATGTYDFSKDEHLLAKPTEEDSDDDGG